MATTRFCACGRRLHYGDPAKQAMVEQLIASTAADVPVQYGTRTWLVQRHYVALHGLKASEIPALKFPELLDGAVFIHFLHDNGGITIRLDKPDYADQYFTHIDPEDGTIRHFHVPKLQTIIKQKSFDIGVFACTPEQASFIMQNHNIDEKHMDRISDQSLNEPGIICLFEDGGGSQLIVDGNHRYVKRTRLGLETMDFWLVPETTWRSALLRVPDSFV